MSNEINNMLHQHVQSHIAETDNIIAFPKDDASAWLKVGEDAVKSNLVPESLTTKLKAWLAVGFVDKAQEAIVSALAGPEVAEKVLASIKPLFRPGDVVQLTALEPEGGPPEILCADLFSEKGQCELIPFIQAHNGRRNLYFGVNPRSIELAGTNQAAQAKDVVRRRTAFVDIDMKDAPDSDVDWTRTRAELENLGPILLVETGNGFHAHYAVEEVAGEDLEASVAPLAGAMAALGSDNVSDLPRIARLPYTVNLPTKSKRARGAIPVLARPAQQSEPLLNPPRSVSEISDAFRDVAHRLALPDRQSGGTSMVDRAGTKTGWAAPSVDLLRLAMKEMPNDGPFDDRGDWCSLAHAVKGAAMAGGMEAEGREIWLKWCEKWSSHADPAADAAMWDGIKQSHTGWGTLMRLLEQHNPAGKERFKAAEAKSAFPPIPSAFQLQPVLPFNVSGLQPRQWLYGRAYIAGYVSVLVAPGGTGKSALVIAEAVAMASGKTLIGGDPPHHALRVWYHNAEDDKNEQLRRLAATMEHHGITHLDLGRRLILTSGRDLPLKLASDGRDGITINQEALETLIAEVEKVGIEVLILDPLGAMHTLPENSNEAANLLMGALREIAERTGVAICLVHHASKAAARDMDAAGAGAARGASALVDGARVVRQLRPATVNDAKELGIPSGARGFYIRVDNGKANLAPIDDARWLHLVSVNLRNRTQDYPKGDDVQTVERWVPRVRVATSPTRRLSRSIMLLQRHRRRSAAQRRQREAGLGTGSQKNWGWISGRMASTLSCAKLITSKIAARCPR